MNVKLYITLVGAAILLIAIIVAIVIGTRMAKPAPTPQTTPTSQLSKPSPLHPVVLGAAARTHAHSNTR
jgi:hypothetical protein